MRLATLLLAGESRLAVVRGDRLLGVPAGAAGGGVDDMRTLAAAGPAALERLAAWADGQPHRAGIAVADATFGPAVPDPGAIYTIGLNYRTADEPAGAEPARPLVYGKAATSVGAHGATLAWDRGVAPTVDAECELGVVVGAGGPDGVPRVFGYTVIDDVSSRDAWLDGDQWLIGKSLPGFCPVGPWIVTPDELDVADLRLGCRIGDEAIQDGRTSAMRFPVPAVLAHLARHLALRPGDLVATGTPPRLAAPPGPDRHLRPGDRVTAWIEGIGELVTTIA